MIEVRIDQLLEKRSRTFYWLAKETGISHTTLWRLKKARAYGLTLDTLEKICHALNCQPGDVLRLASDPKAKKKSSKRKAR
jgi:putative transcriptional regulator